ncbi:HISTONE-LYSINE N-METHYLTRANSFERASE [Salix viminalis]|uniref:HISTONE-LYSINE N-METHYLTRANSFERASE n=1 Tax=Salix viminalis TaxID=40686 RepID=A0A9Q0ZQ86_SALVM|nr:HISTONE-LYSINE N-METHYLTRANSFERASE [Salix viminalis]
MLKWKAGSNERIRNANEGQLKDVKEKTMLMKKLARNWKKISVGDKFTLPTRDEDDSRPMDSREQEELILSLERTEAEQSVLWRRVVGGLEFCYAAFLLYSTFQQALFPWELRYHAYFMEDMDSSMVIFADLIAVSACALAIEGLLHNSKYHRQWIWYSCFVALLLAVFWLYYMLRMPRFRWDVIWLPLGPLSGAGICLYVDHLLTESSEEVKKLRSYMNGTHGVAFKHKQAD